MKKEKSNTMRRTGENILAMFYKLRYVFYMISVILLLFAIQNAYSTFMEGKMAEKNAQISLEMFEQIILKSDSDFEDPYNDGYEENSEIEVDEIKYDDNNEVVSTPTPIVNDTIDQVPYTPIAKLHIKKINLNVTVLSEWSYDLLDISVNKFYGPNPNEPGNFIVIGHNYKNNAHFGSLDLLEVGDLIDLTDLAGRTNTFEVFEILVIKPDEVEKLNTDEVMALTLVTCDVDNTFRLVVKSKVIDAK